MEPTRPREHGGLVLYMEWSSPVGGHCERHAKEVEVVRRPTPAARCATKAHLDVSRQGAEPDLISALTFPQLGNDVARSRKPAVTICGFAVT